MATATVPGGTNTYIPGADGVQSMLVVDFARNIKDFALNQYAQLVPVERNVGRYVKMTIEQCARMENSDNADAMWGDGSDRPSSHGNNESFSFEAYQTRRYSRSVKVGNLAQEQANWDIIQAESRRLAANMMTRRTVKALAVVTNTSNYDSSHYSAVSSISGNSGTWAQSTTARSDIKRSFDTAADIIGLDTNSAVSPEQLIVVISPTDARKMAVSQEMRDYLKGSPDAREALEKRLGPATYFGLPPTFYGYNLIVERTVRLSTRKGATASRAYALPSGTAFMCARPGGLIGVEGAPSFSTLTGFVKEEMTVETFNEPKHRYTEAAITDDYGFVLTAPVTGYVFTSTV